MQEGDLANAFSIPILQNLVFDNLSYNGLSFHFSSPWAISALDDRVGAHIDAISTNLSSFFHVHGGKLLVTQGWADPYNAAIWPIQHLQRLQAQVAAPGRGGEGSHISDFFNLFMVPGGGHCGPATGYPDMPGTYHGVEKLIQWVESGEKPDFVLATGDGEEGVRSRKLCPWPQTATYVGGNIWVEGSFVCEDS